MTPFNGRLFAPARTPLAERRDLDDEAARRAVLALSTRPAPDRAGRERIAYRDLGVEQLGAVYETLLDYEPHVGRRATRSGSECGSGLRKATGTFYTPQPIADYLVRRTLAPLVRDARAGTHPRSFASSIRRWAAARFSSPPAAISRPPTRRRSSATGGAMPAISATRSASAIRRTIAERCLYGVDLNPMAVQLARLSLWLATLAADRPLSFLDHRLQVGDSLLGAWVASLEHSRLPAAPAPSELPLFRDDEVGGALREALPVRFSLESTPNDTLEQVRREGARVRRADRRGTRGSRDGSGWRTCGAPRGSRPDDTPPPAAFGALSDAVLNGDAVRCRRP